MPRWKYTWQTYICVLLHFLINLPVVCYYTSMLPALDGHLFRLCPNFVAASNCKPMESAFRLPRLALSSLELANNGVYPGWYLEQSYIFREWKARCQDACPESRWASPKKGREPQQSKVHDCSDLTLYGQCAAIQAGIMLNS